MKVLQVEDPVGVSLRRHKLVRRLYRNKVIAPLCHYTMGKSVLCFYVYYRGRIMLGTSMVLINSNHMGLQFMVVLMGK